jgi:hypothetical protein
MLTRDHRSRASLISLLFAYVFGKTVVPLFDTWSGIYDDKYDVWYVRSWKAAWSELCDYIYADS